MCDGLVEVIVRHVDLVDGILGRSNDFKCGVLIDFNLVKLGYFFLDGFWAVVDDGGVFRLISLTDSQVSLVLLNRVSFWLGELILFTFLIRPVVGIKHAVGCCFGIGQRFISQFLFTCGSLSDRRLFSQTSNRHVQTSLHL